jgi:hypothetical protein
MSVLAIEFYAFIQLSIEGEGVAAIEWCASPFPGPAG